MSLNFCLLASALGDSHLNIFPCIGQLPIRRELEGELSSKWFASLHSFDLFARTTVMGEGRRWKTWARVRSSHLMRTHPGEVRRERGRYLPFIFLALLLLVLGGDWNLATFILSPLTKKFSNFVTFSILSPDNCRPFYAQKEPRYYYNSKPWTW